MAKIYQFRKKIKGEVWQVCTKKEYDGFKKNGNFSRAFETREVEDNAKPTPNARKKAKKDAEQ